MVGSCPCLPKVEGRQCDKCQSGYWNIDSGTGKWNLKNLVDFNENRDNMFPIQLIHFISITRKNV